MNTKIINMSMPAQLVQQIDKQLRRSGGNRSDFIRQAVRNQLTIFEQWQATVSAVRQNYSGQQLSEDQVADIVRQERNKAR